MSLELYQILSQISSFAKQVSSFKIGLRLDRAIECCGLYRGEKDARVLGWAFEYFQATIDTEGA
ncbi:hypothetical protein [Microcoleus sp. herbarium13]|uniref:hypothetical protein n=1 Tax=Microcoleus sp. herbarium13 TaxID=3055438 RepID=UPI002FCFE85B